MISRFKAHHSIFILIAIVTIQSIYEAIFIEHNFTIETIENQLPYLSFYLAIAFLIKFRYYWASTPFLIPLYIDIKEAINYIISPTPIDFNLITIYRYTSYFFSFVYMYTNIYWMEIKSKIEIIQEINAYSIFHNPCILTFCE